MDVYHAIADSNRRKLLELVAAKERSVQELMPYFDVTVGAVSQHLQVLWASGLVSRRRQGRFRLYKARPRGLKEIHEWTARYRQFWHTRLDRLGGYLEDQE